MSFTTELKVPADEEFTSLVEYAVADAASRAELTGAQKTSLVTASRLGFAAIVRHAMAEAREPIRLVAACTPSDLVVSLFERGLPLDDEMASRDLHWNEIVAEVDAAHWHLHGVAGSELRLQVSRPHGVATHEDPVQIADDDVPLAPEQTYDVRRFRPEDAPGVARAFYYTYGYHYDLPAVYVPERLIELNESNHYTSIVAVAQDGEIAGHYALAREGDEPIADQVLRIPQVDDTGIDQAASVPLIPRIKGQFHGPYDIDAQLRTAIAL